jgi:hypothetical protein
MLGPNIQRRADDDGSFGSAVAGLGGATHRLGELRSLHHATEVAP